MNFVQFQIEMSKLNNVFGERHYPPERIKAFWGHLKLIPLLRLADAMDFLITHDSKPPMLDRILEVIRHRNQLDYENNKASWRQDSADFWSGRLHGDEVRARMDFIKKRLLGKVPDREWEDFMRFLAEQALEEQKEMRLGVRPQ